MIARTFHKLWLVTGLLTAASLTACGNDDDDPQPEQVNITLSQENINAPAEGGSFTVEVSSTTSGWDAYAANFTEVKKANTAGKKGTLTLTVPENPNTEPRTDVVTVMSGVARKAITITQAAAEKPAYNAPDGYTLVWNDEFNSGSELNPNDWTHEVQNPGWVNNELQAYVNHKSPAGKLVTEVKDGCLKIHCFKENGKVYSGRVYAKAKSGWTYGYMEASIRLPKGKGTWPAFWMMPVNFRSWPADGEIDIMEEVGTRPNYVSSSLHANAHVHSNNTQVTHEMFLAGAEGEFHTYAIEWTAQNITTFVDGKVQLTYNNRGLGRDDWPYDAPFYLIFNLAWGGNWGGMNGVDEQALPVTMDVDYVRVFQKK